MCSLSFTVSSRLFHLSSNFSSKVLLLLLDAFTELIARECRYLDISEDILDRLVGILDENLLVEADFLVVLVDAAFDHALNNLLRLALFESLLAENFLLVLESCCIDAAAIDGCRSSCSNLHGNILAELFVAARQVNEDTNLAAHVDVACHTAFALITDEAAQGNLLADRSRSFRDEGSNRLAIELAVVQRIEVSRIRVSDVLGNLGDESAELLVAGSEVRLAVDFDENANLASSPLM